MNTGLNRSSRVPTWAWLALAVALLSAACGEPTPSAGDSPADTPLGQLSQPAKVPCPPGALTDAAHEGLERVNGRYPINSHLRGRVYPPEKLPPDVRAKYPDSVRFKKTGYPDFSPYARELPNGKKRVKVEGLTGKYVPDAKLANAEAGLNRTPDGFTWHHVEDGKSLMLVPTDLHKNVKHTGGSALIRARDAAQ